MNVFDSIILKTAILSCEKDIYPRPKLLNNTKERKFACIYIYIHANFNFGKSVIDYDIVMYNLISSKLPISKNLPTFIFIRNHNFLFGIKLKIS